MKGSHAGSQGGILEAGTNIGTLPTCLISMAYSPCFLPAATCLGWHLPQWAKNSHINLSQENPSYVCPQVSLEEGFSQIMSLFPCDSSHVQLSQN